MARHIPAKPPRARPFLISWAALALLALLSVCAPTRSRAIRNGKDVLDPLVQAIESHRADHGTFPGSLDELTAAGKAPATHGAPSYWNMREQPVVYRASRDKSVFCLKFGYTGVFDRHRTCVYYLSTNGAWLDKPFEPPDVDWEAALLHGQEYQTNGSSAALRGTVTSLAHAQVDWLHVLHIEEALGQPSTPAGDAEAESTFESRYDSRGGATYIFSFDSSGVHEIYEVLRDECGNEQKKLIKKYPKSGR